MFQYAAGLQLAKTQNKTLLLDLTNFYFYKNSDREYGLKYFNIYENIIEIDEIKHFLSRNERILRRIILFLTPLAQKNILIKKLRSFIIIINRNTNKRIDEKDFFKQEDTSSIHLRGTFFGDIYSKKVEKELLVKFKLREEHITERLESVISKIKNSNSVSVHIRRGDYVNNKSINKVFYNLSISYYLSAVNVILNKVHKPIFYIFSDDIDWCKKKFTSINIAKNFISGFKDYEDLELMKNCKHNIIANSSFSWWGAQLNNNPNKIIIAPNRYFNSEKENIRAKVFFPKNWTRL